MIADLCIVPHLGNSFRGCSSKKRIKLARRNREKTSKSVVSAGQHLILIHQESSGAQVAAQREPVLLAKGCPNTFLHIILCVAL